MNNLSGIVAIITSVLGATWYLSAQLATIRTQIADLQVQDGKHASKESYETLLVAIKTLHNRVRALEALIAKKA